MTVMLGTRTITQPPLGADIDGHVLTRAGYPTVSKTAVQWQEWLLDNAIQRGHQDFRNAYCNLDIPSAQSGNDPAGPIQRSNAFDVAGAARGELLYIQLHVNGDTSGAGGSPHNIVWAPDPDDGQPAFNNLAGLPGAPTPKFWSIAHSKGNGDAPGYQGHIDTALIALGNEIKARGARSLICFQHEPDDDYTGNGYTGVGNRNAGMLNWARAFNHLVALWTANIGAPGSAGFPNLVGYMPTFMQIHMRTVSGGQTVTPGLDTYMDPTGHWRTWYDALDWTDTPGMLYGLGCDYYINNADEFSTFEGLDTYSGPNNTTRGAAFVVDEVAKLATVAPTHAVVPPVFFGEIGYSPTGVRNDGSVGHRKAAFIRGMRAYVKTEPRIIALCLQGNLPPANGGAGFWDYDPDDDPDAILAMQQLWNDSYYGGPAGQATGRKYDLKADGGSDGVLGTTAAKDNDNAAWNTCRDQAVADRWYEGDDVPLRFTSDLPTATDHRRFTSWTHTSGTIYRSNALKFTSTKGGTPLLFTCPDLDKLTVDGTVFTRHVGTQTTPGAFEWGYDTATGFVYVNRGPVGSPSPAGHDVTALRRQGVVAIPNGSFRFSGASWKSDVRVEAAAGASVAMFGNAAAVFVWGGSSQISNVSYVGTGSSLANKPTTTSIWSGSVPLPYIGADSGIHWPLATLTVADMNVATTGGNTQAKFISATWVAGFRVSNLLVKQNCAGQNEQGGNCTNSPACWWHKPQSESTPHYPIMGVVDNCGAIDCPQGYGFQGFYGGEDVQTTRLWEVGGDPCRVETGDSTSYVDNVGFDQIEVKNGSCCVAFSPHGTDNGHLWIGEVWGDEVESAVKVSAGTGGTFAGGHVECITVRGGNTVWSPALVTAGGVPKFAGVKKGMAQWDDPSNTAKWLLGKSRAPVFFNGTAPWQNNITWGTITQIPLAWLASTHYSVGDVVQPKTPNGHRYQVTIAGTTGTTTPTFPTGSGATVTSGGVTFKEIGESLFDSASDHPVNSVAGCGGGVPDPVAVVASDGAGSSITTGLVSGGTNPSDTISNTGAIHSSVVAEILNTPVVMVPELLITPTDPAHKTSAFFLATVPRPAAWRWQVDDGPIVHGQPATTLDSIAFPGPYPRGSSHHVDVWVVENGIEFPPRRFTWNVGEIVSGTTPRSAVLGSGTYSVWIMDRRGTRRIGLLPGVGVEWKRVRQGVSEARIMVAAGEIDPECCALLGTLKSWAYSIGVWRDDDPVWEGPLINGDYQAGELDASDPSVWFGRRRLRSAQHHVAVDAALVMQAYVREAVRPDPVGLTTTIVHNAGAAITRDVPADLRIARGEIDAVSPGVPWTVVRRTMRIGRDPSTTPVCVLDDSCFTTPPHPLFDGNGLVTDAIVIGAGTDTAALTGHALAGHADPDQGLHDVIVTASTDSDQFTLDHQAAASITYENDSISDGVLAPTAPVAINQLVPDALFRIVLAKGCRPVNGLYRLDSVDVSRASGQGESVKVAFVPA